MHTDESDENATRALEGELLYSEFAELVTALLESGGLRQKDLAARLSLSEARISRLLRGDANTSLKAIADVGWALGFRFALIPVPFDDRNSTPAHADPEPPVWVEKLRRQVAEHPVAKRPRLVASTTGKLTRPVETHRRSS